MYKVFINNRTFEVTVDDNEISIDGVIVNADIREYKNEKYHTLMKNISYSAEVLSTDIETKSSVIKVGNSVMTVALKDKYDELLHEMGIDIVAGKKVNDIKAPMPGMVLQVMVANGQPIKKGDAIVVLEAMKMENILKSPADGIIKKICVSKGDKVEKNQVMINFD